ncbi:MAG: hypothetical protein IEMM0008_1060 [bacterium]|nr:MAG: hypothetical protein IEMM0008_1060 [bacterium]
MTLNSIALLLSMITVINGFTYNETDPIIYDMSNSIGWAGYRDNVKKYIKRQYLATKVNNKIVKGALIFKDIGNININGSYQSRKKYDKSGKLLSETQYVYDKMDREVERRIIKNSKITRKFKKTYSDNGNVYKKYFYDADNKLFLIEVKKYENELLKEEIDYNPNNRIKRKSIYTYSDSQLQERRFYLYDKRINGLLLASVDYYGIM